MIFLSLLVYLERLFIVYCFGAIFLECLSTCHCFFFFFIVYISTYKTFHVCVCVLCCVEFQKNIL